MPPQDLATGSYKPSPDNNTDRKPPYGRGLFFERFYIRCLTYMAVVHFNVLDIEMTPVGVPADGYSPANHLRVSPGSGLRRTASSSATRHPTHRISPLAQPQVCYHHPYVKRFCFVNKYIIVSVFR